MAATVAKPAAAPAVAFSHCQRSDGIFGAPSEVGVWGSRVCSGLRFESSDIFGREFSTEEKSIGERERERERERLAMRRCRFG